VDNLTIEMFSGETEYETGGFDCGEVSLNAFLTNHLKRQHDGKILRAWLLITKTPRPRILGYYTLSGGSFEKEQLPTKTQQKKVPYHNVPCVILGRLAIDKSLQGNGWGETLVAHAMRVVYNASLTIGIHGLFVEALTGNAKKFYEKLGFIPLADRNQHSLFFPTKSIERLFEE